MNVLQFTPSIGDTRCHLVVGVLGVCKQYCDTIADFHRVRPGIRFFSRSKSIYHVARKQLESSMLGVKRTTG